MLDRGFPGGAVVKNPPANTGDTGSSPGPWSGKIPHAHGATKPVYHNYWVCALEPMTQLRSLRAATTEAREPRAHAPQQEKPRSEKPVHRNKE